ncbi:MAG: hypothetical protein DWI00_15075 [Planctomycetota bacterium]|nr:MAG: hypothetical protein DWI00_15075 [Planctomycetota bacterium]
MLSKAFFTFCHSRHFYLAAIIVDRGEKDSGNSLVPFEFPFTLPQLTSEGFKLGGPQSPSWLNSALTLSDERHEIDKMRAMN